MRWPRAPFELGAERARMHRGARAVRGTCSAAVGANTISTPSRAQSREVGVQRPRVGVEVLAGAELQGVDEDRHHDDGAGHPLGGAHQREVAVVQGAHRGHQHHASPGGAQRAATRRDASRSLA